MSYIGSLNNINDLLYHCRYGWFSNTELRSVEFQAPIASCSIQGEHMNVEKRNEQIVDSTPISHLSTNNQSVDKNSLALTSTDEPNEISGYVSSSPNNVGTPTEIRTLHRKEAGDQNTSVHRGDLVIDLPLPQAFNFIIHSRLIGLNRHINN